jgi:hypothetical protein
MSLLVDIISNGRQIMVADVPDQGKQAAIHHGSISGSCHQ